MGSRRDARLRERRDARQGCDLVERPLIRWDEPFAIAAHMNITCQPQYPGAGVFSWACDNYRIGTDGPHERLHRFPEKITELCVTRRARGCGRRAGLSPTP